MQGNVYMLVGAGGNIAVQVGDDGVLLVDTGLAANAEKVVAAIRDADATSRFATSSTRTSHPDHVGGNDVIGKLGSTIAGGNVGAGAGVGAGIIAHENVLNRMSAPTGQQAPFPTTAWPTDTFIIEAEGALLQRRVAADHPPARRTHRRRQHRVLPQVGRHRRRRPVRHDDVPVHRSARGGSINGIIAALNDMLDIAIPKAMQEGGTYIIPGHGRLTDEADVLEYRDMVTIIRDRIQDGVKRGQTLTR